jgi:hypothetical protein
MKTDEGEGGAGGGVPELAGLCAGPAGESRGGGGEPPEVAGVFEERAEGQEGSQGGGEGGGGGEDPGEGEAGRGVGLVELCAEDGAGDG